MPYSFTATLWEYKGKGAWHFATLPPDLGFEIKCATMDNRVGWGSVRVAATIGKTAFDTSIFPDKASGSYVLPLKAAVRKAENLKSGDQVEISISLI